jgi:hypothetical protein
LAPAFLLLAFKEAATPGTTTVLKSAAVAPKTPQHARGLVVHRNNIFLVVTKNNLIFPADSF